MDKELLDFLQELLELVEEALPAPIAPCGTTFCGLITGYHIPRLPGSCSDGDECRYRYELQARFGKLRGFLDSKKSLKLTRELQSASERIAQNCLALAIDRVAEACLPPMPERLRQIVKGAIANVIESHVQDGSISVSPLVNVLSAYEGGNR